MAKDLPLPPNHSFALKHNMNTPKVKPQQNSDTENHSNTALERSVMDYWGLKHVLRRQPRPQFLNWYETFSRLFGSHDDPSNSSMNHPTLYPLTYIQHMFLDDRSSTFTTSSQTVRSGDNRKPANILLSQY